MLGLGSVALWTSWKMQQILIDSHKQNVLILLKLSTGSGDLQQK